MRKRKFNFYSGKTLKKLSELKSNRYLYLDGINDYAQVEDSSWLNTAVTGDYTWESWLFVPKHPNQPRYIFTSRQNFNGNTFQVMLAWNNQILLDNGSTNVSSQDTIPAGIWFHYAIVVSKSANTVSFYRDGVHKRTTTALPMVNLISPVTFGCRNYGMNAADTLMNIGFRDTRVWNVARTQVEIQDNRSLTFLSPVSNLVANWRFNGDSKDYSGTGKDAAIFNGAQYRYTTRFPLFDSVNDYITFPSSELTRDLRPAYTILSELNYTIRENTVIWEKGANNDGPWLQVVAGNQGTAGGLMFSPNYLSHTNFSLLVISQRAFNDNQWHSVRCDYEGGNARLFVDANLERTVNVGTAFPVNDKPWLLGSRAGVAGFGGGIRRFIIYNRILTDEEYTLYRNGGIPLNPVACYLLNGNALDTSGNDLHAQEYNGVTYGED